MSCLPAGSVTEPGGCVTIPTVPNTPTTAPHVTTAVHSLAFTGVDIVPLVILGVVLVWAGTLLMLRFRGRKS